MKSKQQKREFAPMLTGIYLFLLLSVFPLLVHDGYSDILSTKTNYFYGLTGGYVVCMLVFTVMKCIGKKQIKIQDRLDVTDICVAGFGIIAIVSWLLCDNKKEQFMGTAGRNMGLLTILLTVGAFFCIRKYLEFSEYIWMGMLTAELLVCIVALCNHMGLDPLSMYKSFDSGTAFMSTMGNINTLSGYIGILLPFNMVLFSVCEYKNSKIVYGICAFAGFLGMTSANSDSAYLTVGVTFCVLLFLSKDAKRGERLVWLVLEYAISGLTIAILRFVRGDELCIRLRPGLPKMLLDVRLNLFFAVGCAILLCVFWYCRQKNRQAEDFWKNLRRVLIGILCVALVVLLAVILFVNLAWTKKEAKEHLGVLCNYLYFSNSWGTRRLRIWKASWKIFKRLPILNKFIGVGPAGFYYASQELLTTKELAKFADQGQLVDAHNVYLQALILFGIVGLIVFVGIFVSAAVKFFKEEKKEPYMQAFAVLEIAFLTQAFVNNMHIYIDPFAIILTAVGIGLCTRKK